MTKILKPGHCDFKKGEVGHTKSGLLYVIVQTIMPSGNMRVDVQEEQGFQPFAHLAYSNSRRMRPQGHLWHAWFYDHEGKFLVPGNLDHDYAILISQHFDLL